MDGGDGGLTFFATELTAGRPPNALARAEESLPGLLATEPETPSWMTVFLENWWPSVIERLVSRNIIKTVAPHPRVF